MLPIITTTLPNGSSGECVYINNADDDYTLEIPLDSSVILGNQYTFSMYAKSTKKSVVITITDGAKEETTIEVTNAWQRLKATFTLNAKTLKFSVPACQLYIWKSQLEEGNLLSSWKQSLADDESDQEEVLKSYATTHELQTAIEQLDASITLSVSETYSTKTETEDVVNDKLKDYSTTTAMNTAISLESGNIKQSVSETYTTKEETGDLQDEVDTLSETTTKLETQATQTATQFSWLVADDYSESNVKLSSTAYDLISQNIKISGDNITLTSTNYENISQNIKITGSQVTFDVDDFDVISKNITIRSDVKIDDDFILTTDHIDVNSLFAKSIDANEIDISTGIEGERWASLLMNGSVFETTLTFKDTSGSANQTLLHIEDGYITISNPAMIEIVAPTLKLTGNITTTSLMTGNNINCMGDLKHKGYVIGNTAVSYAAGVTKSIASSTWTTLDRSLDLTTGTFVLVAEIAYAAAKGGRRAARILEGDTALGGSIVAFAADASNSATAYVQSVYIVTPTASTTYKIQAFQSSGSNLNVTDAYLKAVRIA